MYTTVRIALSPPNGTFVTSRSGCSPPLTISADTCELRAGERARRAQSADTALLPLLPRSSRKASPRSLT
eukprot:5819348-Pyramimonas_sp.AAC.1